jgi:hypothetical protein
MSAGEQPWRAASASSSCHGSFARLARHMCRRPEDPPRLRGSNSLASRTCDRFRVLARPGGKASIRGTREFGGAAAFPTGGRQDPVRVGQVEAAVGDLARPLAVPRHQQRGDDAVVGGQPVDHRPELRHLLRAVDVDGVRRPVARDPAEDVPVWRLVAGDSPVTKDRGGACAAGLAQQPGQLAVEGTAVGVRGAPRVDADRLPDVRRGYGARRDARRRLEQLAVVLELRDALDGHGRHGQNLVQVRQRAPQHLGRAHGDDHHRRVAVRGEEPRPSPPPVEQPADAG